MHGISINITNESLKGFSHIIPCGLYNTNITCLHNEISSMCAPPTILSFTDIFLQSFQKIFNVSLEVDTLLLQQYRSRVKVLDS